MADTLIELAERCEKAAGPDRELDALIMGACFDWARPEPPYLAPHCVGDEPIYWHAPEPYYKRPVPKVTASLDAAMTLVPEGWAYKIGRNWCELWPCEAEVELWEWEDRQHHAVTPSLALCAAALRARAAMEMVA